MLPVMVDVASAPVAVIGNGFSAALRLRTLLASGAGNITTFATDPEPDVLALCPDGFESRWPAAEELAEGQFKIVYLCDVEEALTLELHAAAHRGGALVNTHDRKDLCDFHMPAILRRGDLQVTVSTNGQVAGLARILRDELRDHVIGPEWADRVSDLGAKRAQWVAEKLPFSELKAKVDAYVAEQNWLPHNRPPPKSN